MSSAASVDFWLDSSKYADYTEDIDQSSEESLVFNIDMVRLASVRKAISNFVRILTRLSIPVYFNDQDENCNIGGKQIFISAGIRNKMDFDVAVGTALHEAAHTVKSDFEVAKALWANIPKNIFVLSDAKNIRRQSMEKFIHTMWNVIEDRYIDNWVFNSAPGYRGYYVSMYNRYWNSPEIDEIMVSELYRFPSLASYQFRITNLTNENTDLLALPRLEDIARTIDLSNIGRLTTTKKRIQCAFEVVEIVLDCLDKQQDEPQGPSKMVKGKGKGKNGLISPSDIFDFGDEDPQNEEKEQEDPSQSEGNDVGTKTIHEISDILNGRDPDPTNLKENKDLVGKVSDEEVGKEVEKQLKDIEKKQKEFLKGQIPKEKVTSAQKALLDLIEKHGITLVQVKLPNFEAGDSGSLKVDCIVVQNMTKELILAGQDVFPLSAVMKIGKGEDPAAPEENVNTVQRGIAIGTKLGRKLQIRAESNIRRDVRKKSGKLNKRLIHTAAFDAEDLFYKIHEEHHNDVSLHITVDASSSMAIGGKWKSTMTAVVAVCKAASMVDNIHVTVSFRSTQGSSGSVLPYVILAYDSKKDKFSKVRNLFPYLTPNGWTPEGLAFGAIMGLFDGITPDEQDRYFLNLSDGEPCYVLHNHATGVNVSYAGETGTSHTKKMVDKIRRNGVEILSYFISDEVQDTTSVKQLDPNLQKVAGEEEPPKEDPLKQNFRKMYGKTAKFINVESVVDLAKTMNQLFLTNADEKSA